MQDAAERGSFACVNNEHSRELTIRELPRRRPRLHATGFYTLRFERADDAKAFKKGCLTP
jgi:hypothetical protein